VDFAWPPLARQLEGEIATFLDEHFPPELAEQVYRSGVSHDAGFAAAMAERDWIEPGWDPEGAAHDYGPFEAHMLEDRLSKAEAPTYAVATSRMVARVVHRVAVPDLRDEVVPAVMRGEVLIALGMTEPEAGSDVAAVQTRARLDGDEWVIDGQKMFTTNGHVTDYVFLLTRTNPEVPKHQGLTTFLVPLDHPGVEAQAVYTLSGERTNIMFFNDVRLPDRFRLGEVDGGWDVLMLSLQDEHSAGFSAHLERALEATAAWASETADESGRAKIDDPQVRERLAAAATELEVAQLLERRVTYLESISEVPVAEGPMAKLFGTEALVRHAEQLAELIGPDALRSKLDPTALHDGDVEHARRFSLGTTIYAGTSEIQRNIIAQRACGLPR
jgi:alkylation response protein AidB-like acyl-CoA dehydrogenase